MRQGPWVGFAQRGGLIWFGAVLRTDCKGKQKQKQGDLWGGPCCGRQDRGLGPGMGWEWTCEKLEHRMCRWTDGLVVRWERQRRQG